jgi:hypothetical protein
MALLTGLMNVLVTRLYGQITGWHMAQLEGATWHPKYGQCGLVQKFVALCGGWTPDMSGDQQTELHVLTIQVDGVS